MRRLPLVFRGHGHRHCPGPRDRPLDADGSRLGGRIRVQALPWQGDIPNLQARQLRSPKPRPRRQMDKDVVRPWHCRDKSGDLRRREEHRRIMDRPNVSAVVVGRQLHGIGGGRVQPAIRSACARGRFAGS